MTEYMHTGVVLLAISLACWLLQRGLARVSGQVAAVADSLGKHIVEDDRQHTAAKVAIQQVWAALPRQRS